MFCVDRLVFSGLVDVTYFNTTQVYLKMFQLMSRGVSRYRYIIDLVKGVKHPYAVYLYLRLWSKHKSRDNKKC